GDEALHQHAVESVILHPLEVPGHDLRGPGGEHIRGLAAGGPARDLADLAGGELAEIRVHIDGQSIGSRHSAPPMAPSLRRSVRRGAVEPALITDQHLTLQSRRIDWAGGQANSCRQQKSYSEAHFTFGIARGKCASVSRRCSRWMGLEM